LETFIKFEHNSVHYFSIRIPPPLSLAPLVDDAHLTPVDDVFALSMENFLCLYTRLFFLKGMFYPGGGGVPGGPAWMPTHPLPPPPRGRHFGQFWPNVCLGTQAPGSVKKKQPVVHHMFLYLKAEEKYNTGEPLL
jgi:hypothetical protein